LTAATCCPPQRLARECGLLAFRRTLDEARSAGTNVPSLEKHEVARTSSRAARPPPCRPGMTRACGAPSLRSAAMVRSARYSWMKPITRVRITMTTIAMESCGSPTTPATTAAASQHDDHEIGELARQHQPGRAALAFRQLVAPCASRRLPISPLASPVRVSVPRRGATSAASRRCQSGRVSAGMTGGSMAPLAGDRLSTLAPREPGAVT